MKVKTYEYQRGSSALLTIKVDGTIKGLDFTGGRQRPYIKLPRYVTSEEKEQKAIENSPQFKAGLIKCAGEQEAVVDKNESNTDNLNAVAGIDQVQMAREYMLDKYEDLKAGDLNNKQAILSKAQEKGIYFPDLK
jgi:hypothetical protein